MMTSSWTVVLTHLNLHHMNDNTWKWDYGVKRRGRIQIHSIIVALKLNARGAVLSCRCKKKICTWDERWRCVCYHLLIGNCFTINVYLIIWLLVRPNSTHTNLFVRCWELALSAFCCYTRKDARVPSRDSRQLPMFVNRRGIVETQHIVGIKLAMCQDLVKQY